MNLELIDQLLALGPAGLLLAAIVFQHRQSEKRIAALEQQLAAAQAELKAEHQARLQDLTANQGTLLEVHDQTHKSLGVVGQVLERLERRPR